MARINRVPRGYLGFLDAKAGITPGELPDSLNLFLDMTQFYAADLDLEIEQATQSGVTTVSKAFAPILVPQGQQWMVYAITAEVVGTAGTGPVTYGAEIRARGSSVAVPLNSKTDNIAAVGNIRGSANLFPEPLFCGSGTRFSTLIGENPGTLVVVTHVLFRRTNI